VQQLEQTPVKLVRQVVINRKKELPVAYIASLGNTSRKKNKQLVLSVMLVEHQRDWPEQTLVIPAPKAVTSQHRVQPPV